MGDVFSFLLLMALLYLGNSCYRGLRNGVPSLPNNMVTHVRKGDVAKFEEGLRRNRTVVTMRDSETGYTLAHYAVLCNKLAALALIAKSYPDYGAEQIANLNAKGFKDGNTPLHLAAMHDRLNILKFLLEQESVCINKTDNQGKTALHWAVQSGSSKCVYWLLVFGADAKMRNGAGKSPYDLISMSNDKEAMHRAFSDGLADAQIRLASPFQSLQYCAKYEEVVLRDDDDDDDEY